MFPHIEAEHPVITRKVVSRHRRRLQPKPIARPLPEMLRLTAGDFAWVGWETEGKNFHFSFVIRTFPSERVMYIISAGAWPVPGCFPGTS
jgi:hypothetical protein